MKMKGHKTIVEKQEWKNEIRIIIINDFGSVHLDLYKEKQEDDILAFIYNLWVNPKYRRKGHAKYFMDYAEKMAIIKGYDKVHLRWDLENTSLEILEWYKRNGYIPVKIYDANSILLCKDLTNFVGL